MKLIHVFGSVMLVNTLFTVASCVPFCAYYSLLCPRTVSSQPRSRSRYTLAVPDVLPFKGGCNLVTRTRARLTL